MRAGVFVNQRVGRAEAPGAPESMIGGRREIGWTDAEIEVKHYCRRRECNYMDTYVYVYKVQAVARRKREINRVQQAQRDQNRGRQWKESPYVSESGRGVRGFGYGGSGRRGEERVSEDGEGRRVRGRREEEKRS